MPRIHMGDVGQSIETTALNIWRGLDTMATVANDPAFGRVIQLVAELDELERRRDPEGYAAYMRIPVQQRIGIGLRRIVPPLELYVAARRNPAKALAYAGAVGFAGLAVIVGVPLAIGYFLGKGKR